MVPHSRRHRCLLRARALIGRGAEASSQRRARHVRRGRRGDAAGAGAALSPHTRRRTVRAAGARRQHRRGARRLGLRRKRGRGAEEGRRGRLMAEALANSFIYLMGVAGAGKLTVAKAIAAKTGARLVDNHLINNPIFTVVRQDGVTPLPRAVWDRTFAIRTAVLETIASLSPPEWSFVFTHEAYGEAYDIAVYQLTRKAAAVRKAKFLPVRLVCDPDEIANPERRVLMKSANAAKSRARA